MNDPWVATGCNSRFERFLKLTTGKDYYVEIKRTSASNWSCTLSNTNAFDGIMQLPQTFSDKARGFVESMGGVRDLGKNIVLTTCIRETFKTKSMANEQFEAFHFYA